MVRQLLQKVLANCQCRDTIHGVLEDCGFFCSLSLLMIMHDGCPMTKLLRYFPDLA